MDADRFDRLAIALTLGTRRSLVRLLVALPLGVTLAARLGKAPEATAKADGEDSSHRRHRRKARHHHRRKCTPKSKAQICAGKCGTVRTKCGKQVECGPCGCRPVANAITCAGKCGTVPNNCGQAINCTPLCDGCCSGAACVALGSQSDTQCGHHGAACTSCADGRVCIGNGVCAHGCHYEVPVFTCPCGSCERNLSGGPSGVCLTDTDGACVADCAECAAQERVCFETDSACDPAPRTGCGEVC